MKYEEGDVVQGRDARIVLLGGGELRTMSGRSDRRWSNRFGLERKGESGWRKMDLTIERFPQSEMSRYRVTQEPPFQVLLPEEGSGVTNTLLDDILEEVDMPFFTTVDEALSRECKLQMEISEEEEQELRDLLEGWDKMIHPLYAIGPEEVERLQEMGDDLADEKPETTEDPTLTDLSSRAESDNQNEEDDTEEGSQSTDGKVEVITENYEGALEVGPGSTLVYPGLDRILHVDKVGTLHSIAPGDTIPLWMFGRLLDVDNLIVDVHVGHPLLSSVIIFDGLDMIESEDKPSPFADAEEKEALANVGDAWIRLMLERADMGIARDIICPEEGDEPQKQGISPVESELKDLREGALKKVEELNHIVERTKEHINVALKHISGSHRSVDVGRAQEILLRADRLIEHHRETSGQ